jgi:uncharacterized membrane protein YdjX (TVP38/TMEM64 family)
VTWWLWTLLWIALVLAGALVLFLTGRRLYRQGMALARELGAAADSFAEVSLAMQAGASTRGEVTTRRTP